MFQKLPPELLAEIIELVGFVSVRDLMSLSQVSNHVRSAVVPIMYRFLIMGPHEQQNTEDVDSSNLESARQKGYLKYTRGIDVTARIHPGTRPYLRCAHCRSWPDGIVPKPTNLLSILESCQPDSLKSFRWGLGACIPDEIFGPAGNLNLHQTKIESLSLITDGSCSRALWAARANIILSTHMTAFPNLKELSWAGLSSNSDFHELCTVLRQRHGQLERLELDFEYHVRLQAETYEDVLTRILWQYEPEVQLFPALRHLALCSVAFTPSFAEVANPRHILFHSFDFFSLTSLRIRHCPGYDNLLKYLIESDETLQLTSFELQARAIDDNIVDRHIVRFLASFTGLRDLFLLMPAFMKPMDIWQTLPIHRDTLVRFAYHQRLTRDAHRPDQVRVEHKDYLNLNFRRIDDFSSDPTQNPLGAPDLAALAIGCDPEWLRLAVSPYARKNSLELLHLRRSGPDLVLESRMENAPPEPWSFRDIAPNPNDPNGRPRLEVDVNPEAVSAYEFASLVERVTSDYHRYTSVIRDELTANDPAEPGPKDEEEPTADDLMSPKYIYPGLDVFLQWVFGPQGIRSLRVFAYGDFTHFDRFDIYCCCFRRNDVYYRNMAEGRSNHDVQPYLEVLMDDPEVGYLFKKHESIMLACPADSLFDLSDMN